MAEDIKISAVIATYNREATIARAIDSILAQEAPASEIVVIDDGSTDATPKVLDAYGNKIRYIRQPNAGVAATRNRGVQEARSEWVAFLDSDDLWLPGHLKRMQAAIRATAGKAAIYFSDLEKPTESGPVRHWARCGMRIEGPYELREDAADWVFMHVQPLMVQASTVHRQRYLECGGLPNNMRVREDTLLFYKLGLLHPACAVAGCGMIQKDDVPVRLTRQLDEFTVKYCLDTVTMYKEVLSLAEALRPARRRRVIGELSASYFGAGRAFYRQREYLQMLRYILWSARTSPRVWAQCTAHSLGRFLPRPKSGEASTLPAQP
jgi:glycosyltransferase involved in cell wall biosynthesis